jgi:PleD family two-component response regulator
MQYIKKFTQALNDINFSFNDFNFDVEVTFGVTLCKEHDTATKLLERATKALVKAKKGHSSNVEFLL